MYKCRPHKSEPPSVEGIYKNLKKKYDKNKRSAKSLGNAKL